MTVPFCGRGPQLVAIAEALEAARSGRGGCVAVSGEAGIGKTRFLAKTADLAEQRGFRVLWSQVFETPGAPPFLAWRLPLRSLLAATDRDVLIEELGDAAADLAAIVPELPGGREDPSHPPTDDGVAVRFRLLDSVTRLLIAAAGRRPLLLLFDNLHLADRSSLALLEYYVQQIAGSATLVVGAHRSGPERSSALERAISRLSRTPRFQSLELVGLARDEVAELLYASLDHAPPAALVDALYAKSDGNALFVCEVARMLAGRSGSGRPATAHELRVPDSLRELIAARLEALPSETRDLLRAASVLGRHFEARTLGAVAREPVGHVLRALGPAERAGVLQPTRHRFRFQHALHREVLYAEHPPERRASLHRRAADHLAERHADDLEPLLSRIALHYFEGAAPGDESLAVEYCRRAAESAISDRAFAEAADLYERALEACRLEAVPDLERRFDLLVALGSAQYRSGRAEPATRTLLAAALLAHRQRWWRRLADAVVTFQMVCSQVGLHHVASIPLHEGYLANAAPSSPTALRVEASLASAYLRAGKREKAAATLRENIARARRQGDRAVLLHSVAMAHFVLRADPLNAGDAEALELAREALELAEHSDSTGAVLECSKALLFPLCRLGEIGEAQDLLVELERLARAERHPHYLNLAAGFATAIAILQGRWEDAISLARRALRPALVEGFTGLEGRFSFQMFTIERARGRLSEIADAMDAVVGQVGSSELWLPGAVLLHCELGRLGAARDLLATAGDPDEIARDELYLPSLVYLVEASVQLRDERRAARIFERLLPYRHLNVDLPGTMMLGAMAGFLAPVAAFLRKEALTRELFEDALAMNERMGAAPALTRTRTELAAWLMRSDRPEEQARARRLLGQAAPAARDLDLRPVLARIEEIETAAAIGRLTPREVEVLRHIAAGSSNKEIAATLFISHSTVATHVRHILRKTGTANRTEAADWARRHDLVGPP